MTPRLHPAERYARDVLNGRIPACHWIRRASQRYFDDVKNAKKKGICFDREQAQDAIDFFGTLTLTEGEFAGRPFELFGWEQFVVWNIFGWYRAEHPRWLIKLPDGRTEDTSGTRRFRVVYLEIASKNGKTSLLAGVGLKVAFAEQEMGAQVFSVATKRDQAKLCWGLAKRMTEETAFLRVEGGVEVLTNNLNQLSTGSKFEPLASDYKTMDGLNIHGAICDEVHEWPSRALYDKIRQKTSSRRNPLIFMITTAGDDTLSFCHGQREYTCKVLDGIVENEEWFGVIYTVDEGDDPFVERNWFKANPSLGESKKISDMRTLAQVAKEIPTEMNAFLRYQLNIWTRAETKWMNMDSWRLSAGPVPASALEDFLRGRDCYGGLDLAFTQDLAACVYVFPPNSAGIHYESPVKQKRPAILETHKRALDYIKNTGGRPTIYQFDEDHEPIGAMLRRDMNKARLIFEDNGRIIVFPDAEQTTTEKRSDVNNADDDPLYYALCRFFCPEDSILKRSQKDRVPYDLWADQGWIIPTPGDFIEHEFIFAHIKQDMDKFHIREIAFDRFGAEWITTALQNIGLTMVQFGQGYVSMSPPMKDLEVLIGKHQLAHGDNPVLTWNADNVIASMDPAGNVKPDKQKSREKIDGIVALIMALSRAMVHDPESGKSIYETRGILTI